MNNNANHLVRQRSGYDAPLLLWPTGPGNIADYLIKTPKYASDLTSDACKLLDAIFFGMRRGSGYAIDYILLKGCAVSLGEGTV